MRNAVTQAHLATIATRYDGVPLRHVDGVDAPIDDGVVILVPIRDGGVLIEVLWFTPEQYYDCLQEVMAATLPGSADGIVH